MAEKAVKAVNYLKPWMVLLWLFLLMFLVEYWGIYYQRKNGSELTDFQIPIAKQMRPELFYRDLLITLSILGITASYLLSRLHRFAVKQVIVHKMNGLLLNIIRCQDGQIVEHARKLGILVNGRSVRLPVEVMAFASPKYLADLITALFYIHQEEIVGQLKLSSCDVFYSLADELTKYWKDARLDEFIASFKENKLLFGCFLASALEKRAYENQISLLEQQISRIQEDEEHRLDEMILNGLIEKNLESVRGKVERLTDTRPILMRIMPRFFDNRPEPELAENLSRQ